MTWTDDLVVYSHLRWDFVFQRPQHLLTRAAQGRRVFFVEEPLIDSAEPRLVASPRPGGVIILQPHLPAPDATTVRALLDQYFDSERLSDHIAWYYTPMALPFSDHRTPRATIYDCMDELSLFRGAPAGLLAAEQALIDRATLVFTGGQSLYEAKRNRHSSVHCFPSSIDVDHFGKARLSQHDPADQSAIPHPRFGFAGVIDERMDLDLIDGVATARPDWQLVMIGPVVKIDPASLPHHANVHWLGGRDYADLPAYFSGWDVAMLPFALNESTRFISPTKTPEYLAAGLPVISTPIRDVVRPYGDRGLVRIATTVEEFVQAGEAALTADFVALRRAADDMLATMSWQRTWEAMSSLIADAIARDRVLIHS